MRIGMSAFMNVMKLITLQFTLIHNSSTDLPGTNPHLLNVTYCTVSDLYGSLYCISAVSKERTYRQLLPTYAIKNSTE